MQQTKMGVGVCDSDGALVMISPALAAMLGTGYSRTKDHAWADHYCLHDEDGEPLPPCQDPLARALRGERITDEVVSVRRPGQPVRWILCSGFQLHGPDPEPVNIGAAVFVVDVTARATEQQRLAELRDRLVETVNHEVRTPLAVIAGHLELIEPAVQALPQGVQRSLAAMNRASARLTEVVATISELADQS